MANTHGQTTRNTSSRYADASTQRATAANWIECAYRALGEGAAQQGLSMSTFEDVMGVPAWKVPHPEEVVGLIARAASGAPVAP